MLNLQQIEIGDQGMQSLSDVLQNNKVRHEFQSYTEIFIIHHRY